MHAERLVRRISVAVHQNSGSAARQTPFFGRFLSLPPARSPSTRSPSPAADPIDGVVGRIPQRCLEPGVVARPRPGYSMSEGPRLAALALNSRQAMSSAWIRRNSQTREAATLIARSSDGSGKAAPSSSMLDHRGPMSSVAASDATAHQMPATIGSVVLRLRPDGMRSRGLPMTGAHNPRTRNHIVHAAANLHAKGTVAAAQSWKAG